MVSNVIHRHRRSLLRMNMKTAHLSPLPLLRRELKVVGTLLVCGLCLYFLSPGLYETLGFCENCLVERKERVVSVQKTSNEKTKTNQLNDPQPRPTPNTDTSASTINTYKEKYAAQLKNIKRPRNLFFASDSHGVGLEEIFQKYLPDWKITVSFYRGYTVQQVHEEILPAKPNFAKKQTCVIFHVGTNNFFFRKKNPRASARERDSNEVIITSVGKALKALRKTFHNASIIYSANLPRYDIAEYAKRKEHVNNMIKENMASIQRSYFVDHTVLFQNEKEIVNRELFVQDGLHLNKAGKHILVRNLIEAMIRTLR